MKHVSLLNHLIMLRVRETETKAKEAIKNKKLNMI